MNTYQVPAAARRFVVTYCIDLGYLAALGAAEDEVMTDAGNWIVTLVVRRWRWDK